VGKSDGQLGGVGCRVGKGGGHIIGCGALHPHGHAQGPVVELAVDVVQVRLGVPQDALTHAAVVPRLQHPGPNF